MNVIYRFITTLVLTLVVFGLSVPTAWAQDESIIARVTEMWLSDGRLPSPGQRFNIPDSIGGGQIVYVGDLDQHEFDLGKAILKPNMTEYIQKVMYPVMNEVVRARGYFYGITSTDSVGWRNCLSVMIPGDAECEQELAEARKHVFLELVTGPRSRGGNNILQEWIRMDTQAGDYQCIPSPTRKCWPTKRSVRVFGLIRPGGQNPFTINWMTELAGELGRLIDEKIETAVAPVRQAAQAAQERADEAWNYADETARQFQGDINALDERVSTLERIADWLQRLIPEEFSLTGGVLGSQETGIMTNGGVIASYDDGSFEIGFARGTKIRQRIVPARGPEPLEGRPWSGYIDLKYFPLKFGKDGNTAITVGFHIEPWTTDLSRDEYPLDHEEDATRLAFPAGVRHSFDGTVQGMIFAEAGYSIHERHQRNIEMYSGSVSAPGELDLTTLKKHPVTTKELYFRAGLAISF